MGPELHFRPWPEKGEVVSPNGKLHTLGQRWHVHQDHEKTWVWILMSSSSFRRKANMHSGTKNPFQTRKMRHSHAWR